MLACDLEDVVNHSQQLHSADQYGKDRSESSKLTSASGAHFTGPALCVLAANQMQFGYDLGTNPAITWLQSGSSHDASWLVLVDCD